MTEHEQRLEQGRLTKKIQEDGATMTALKTKHEDWAIIGYDTGRFPCLTLRFAGGRSRRKLECIARRMNEAGGCRVSVQLVRLVRAP